MYIYVVVVYLSMCMVRHAVLFFVQSPNFTDIFFYFIAVDVVVVVVVFFTAATVDLVSTPDDMVVSSCQC